MSFWEFYNLVYAESINKGWRIGQSLWNNLCLKKFSVFEKMKDSGLDPFYAQTVINTEFVKAVEFIKTHWDD